MAGVSSTALAWRTSLGADSGDDLAFRQNRKFSFPGGVADLRWRKDGEAEPTVKYGLHDVILLDSGDTWRALIGLDIQTSPGDYVLHVKAAAQESPAYGLVFSVTQKNYTGADADSNASQLAALIEVEDLSDLDFSNSAPPNLPWQPPIETTWDDQFGQYRLADNGHTHHYRNWLAPQERSTDTDAGSGTDSSVSATPTAYSTVVAPQQGIVCKLLRQVSAAQSTATELVTLVIDHGRGLYCIVSGVEDVTVDLGDGIAAGAVLGKIRQAQSHISFRWQCVMNGAYVNPLILTQIDI